MNEKKELIISDNEISRPMSLQQGMSLLPVEQQEKVLTEYDKRRSFFLKWLFSHLVEGISYGFPPGCEAKYDENGDMLQYSRKNNTWTRVSSSQWIAKPSLYDAGARLVVDLLHLKPTYKNDKDAWEMAGKPGGVIFRTCQLVDQASQAIIGEGTGAYKINDKGMDENAAPFAVFFNE